MFGWEFPPKSTGGLGTACYGLTKGLANKGVQVTFVLPISDNFETHITILPAFGNINYKPITSVITPYMTATEYSRISKFLPNHSMYGANLFEEVQRYTEEAKKITSDELNKNSFDVIHCHDWLTFKAGIIAKKISGKPLIVHVHATEFDRTANQGVNLHVYEIEKQGLQFADKIIAVSHYTKAKIVEHYNIDPNKIEVVYNAVELSNSETNKEETKETSNKNFPIKNHEKIVLYLGRLTIQKGPDYFLEAAKKVIDFQKKKLNKNSSSLNKVANSKVKRKTKKESSVTNHLNSEDVGIKFIIVGTGDMEHLIIEKAAELGISNNVLFAGHLSGSEVDRAYKLADLYIMPSVSEPFGITPLEAARNKTPVIISKQSGVSEILKHCFKVDFWDTDELANYIIALLSFQDLHSEISNNSFKEIKKLSWDKAAENCIDIYNSFKIQQIAR